MKLSDFDLKQLDEAYVRTLTPEALLALCLKLLADTKEKTERLNQNPSNSWGQGSISAKLRLCASNDQKICLKPTSPRYEHLSPTGSLMYHALPNQR